MTANRAHSLSSESSWPGRPDGQIEMGTNTKDGMSGVHTWCYGNTEVENKI